MRKFFWLPVLFVLFSCSRNDDSINLEPVKKENPGTRRNIILMIGDGMGLSQITGTRTVNGGKLNMLRCRSIGLQSTHSADKYVTESAAAATAIACGEKTNNYFLGVDTAGNPIPNLFELLEAGKISTGLVTTSIITDATPAGFYAHQSNRYNYEAIALELIVKEVDFFAGGGKKYFYQRTDGLNLLDSLFRRNYYVTDDLNALIGSKKTAVFIAENMPLTYTEGRGDFLPNSVAAAVNHLKQNQNGFFLMIEGAQIDWACEENDQEYLMAEMLDFDRAVGEALDFAEADGQTLVIITGDHETGGFALTDGNVAGNYVQGQFTTLTHTGTMIPLFAYGPGEEVFAGIYENTAIFKKIVEFYGLQP